MRRLHLTPDCATPSSVGILRTRDHGQERSTHLFTDCIPRFTPPIATPGFQLMCDMAAGCRQDTNRFNVKLFPRNGAAPWRGQDGAAKVAFQRPGSPGRF